MSMKLKIVPVILAGGVGTRLWPLSRETFPKQFLRLVSQYSLLQETVLRTRSLTDLANPLIVCNLNHYFISHDHLKEIGIQDCHFILEPFGRNTAPAIAAAAQWALQEYADSATVLLVLPSDHYIADQQLFLEAVNQAKNIAEHGFLVTFGVVPTSPETGYGYIESGEPISECAFKVVKFIEKPPLELAKQYVETSNFYWNSGMFMFTPQAYLQELNKYTPEVHQAAVKAIRLAEKKEDYIRLDQQAFLDCPNISIDYAVMEKTAQAIVIPLASSWNDLGCWTAVAKAGSYDAKNNVIRGEVVIQDSEDCFISSEGQMIAALGLSNQIIVSTPDVVLVANKSYSQEVKNLVHQLKLRDSHLVAHHKKQYDSSGYTENIVTEDNFVIEYFMLKPFATLTLPANPHPIWLLVVTGKLEVLVGSEIKKLSAQHSVYLPGMVNCHFFNKHDQPLHFLRVQLKANFNKVNEKTTEEVTV